ncbi:MAG: FG-GAP repeat protein, partial [Planctomycetes bacterium]|nr:FG-GAP repeat protein [Planctomycetota bacterium]
MTIPRIHHSTRPASFIVGTSLLALASTGSALAQPGWVLSHQKISDTEGGFTGVLDDQDFFGSSVASLGDLDGDGVADRAVGAYSDDDGGVDHGAVWILFLNADGTVKSHQKISDTQGGFTGVLDDGDYFGRSVASLGDLDGDGASDLAVGIVNHDADDGSHSGAVWVLFLNPDGTVKSHQKISSTQGGFTGILDIGDSFGSSLASLGDLDGDGVGDLAVGATGDDDGGAFHGAVWVLFLNSDGTVKAHQKISDTQGGFTGNLGIQDWFGSSLASLGDLDGDGAGDLAVGAMGDGDGGFRHGAVWVLFLNTDGTVKAHQKISDTQGGFTGDLDETDFFGRSVASLGDLDGDGVGDLAVGAYSDDDGGAGRGAG